MADLKPIGSEKLTGMEKVRRIMEIATYKETKPTTINETNRTDYSITLADGNDYQIVKERQGYIIKKQLTEGQLDYIEPMKNRKYYPSYSQALKRLNLLTKEVNRLTENEEEISLFGEQKKFVLKTPKPAEPAMDAPIPPAEPTPVPAPELPASDEATPDAGMEDMSTDELDMTADEMGPEGDTEVSADVEMGSEVPADVVTFKQIQKLTGKLTQKIREFDQEKGLTSEDMKYVINMVLSALELDKLSEEDREDVLSKFESDMEDMEDTGDMGAEEDITSDTEVEDIQADMDVAVEGDMGEAKTDEIFDSIFSESKVDKVISKYFEISEEEKKLNESKKKLEIEKRMNSVKNLCESVEQELASQKFLEENSNFRLVGKTNKNNLIFKQGNKQVKITTEGILL